jgi:hypothetical protein|tara:strand:- start:798 stop:902 length:105 start_codon:yes stop_codon:yes gene_type:complete
MEPIAAEGFELLLVLCGLWSDEGFDVEQDSSALF